MKNFPTQRQFLNSKKKAHTSEKELIELKKQYRKLYFQEYNKRRQKPITYTLRLKRKDYKRIKAFQHTYKYNSLNQCIIDTLFAYIDKSYVFPQEESKQQLINELNAIGTNINQVVHKLHLHSLRMEGGTGMIDPSEENLSRILHGYQILKEQVDLLKRKILEFIHTPQPSLLSMSWNEIHQDKSKLSSLISHLQEQLNSL